MKGLMGGMLGVRWNLRKKMDGGRPAWRSSDDGDGNEEVREK